MRIQAIDSLRGLAILGILTMNIGFHVNILTGYVSLDPPLVSDKVILIIQAIFADGRFRSLFCIIFGVGLAILYERGQQKQIDPIIYLKSRLFWLFIIGLIHAAFIFGGDILMLYALAGYIVIKHLPKDPEEILRLGKRRFIAGSVMCVILGILAILFTPPEDIITRSSEAFASKYAFLNANYLYYIGANAGIALVLLIFSFLSIIWQVFGLMLIGMYLYHSNFFVNGFSRSALYKTAFLAVVTTSLSLTPYALQENVDATVTPLLASVPAIFVSLIYAHVFIRLSKDNGWLMRTLNNCGKVALSLYIFQSVSMAVLFKIVLASTYPDYIASISLLHLMGITAMLTVVQMLLANWLVSHYEQGPLEYIWRKVYTKRYESKTAKISEQI
ncbi:DUF418 domain-containing protein [Ningiella sp. W23]|uniref:DUF418 domain-containing protein n=1 Tax=Ningiella sp. W23 TaxID=3023715 RepID=UPI003757DA15